MSDSNKNNVINLSDRSPKIPSSSAAPARNSIADKVRNIEHLPAIPDLALQILKIRDNPDATVEELVDIIMLDPALSAQVIRYANSPLFGQRGTVKTLDDAIFRVLGYESVLYMALGTAMAQAFRLPEEGPLGLNQFWRNATYSAALMQNLSNIAPRSVHLQPGISYMCGLLHNIGYLVLAQVFQNEYTWANKVIASKPDEPITTIEQQLLGATHADLGQLLMQSWSMPGEITACASEHHNPAYDGEFAKYVWLTQLSDQLLKPHGLSDADTDELSLTQCEQLGLSPDQLDVALNDVIESKDVLESIVHMLAG